MDSSITHIAANQLGPNGELYRACDGGPLDPMPPLYELHAMSPEHNDVPIVFCEECKRRSQLVGRN